MQVRQQLYGLLMKHAKEQVAAEDRNDKDAAYRAVGNSITQCRRRFHRREQAILSFLNELESEATLNDYLPMLCHIIDIRTGMESRTDLGMIADACKDEAEGGLHSHITAVILLLDNHIV